MTEHRTTIGQSVTKPGARPERYDKSRFTPRCSCGWTGRATTNKSAANDDAEEHVLTMARHDL